MGCKGAAAGRFVACLIVCMSVLSGCHFGMGNPKEPKVWTGLENCVLLSFDNSSEDTSGFAVMERILIFIKEMEYTVPERIKMNRYVKHPMSY